MADTKTFFLTGCASGIGKHLTQTFLEQGHRVFATDLNLDALEEQASQGNWSKDHVTIRPLDVRDPEAWEKSFGEAVDTLGRIDVCMNIAGVMQNYWAHEYPQKYVDLLIDVNLKGLIYGTQTAAKHMIEKGAGHIVNFASLAGVTPIPGLSVYCASKFAVRAFSLTAAQELRPHGVYVTTVCPDAVDTPLLDVEKKFEEEAALVFHANKLLTVHDIERAIVHKVLPNKPEIVYLPFVGALLARFSAAFPSLAKPLLPLILKQARANQGKVQQKARELR